MMEPKRRRTYTQVELTHLDQAWDNGMTSTRSLDQIKKMADILGLSHEQVKAWIGNKRGKLRHKGQDQPLKKHPTPLTRGPNAFSLFCEGKKRGNKTAKEYFVELSSEWAGLSTSEKADYSARAKEIRRHPTVGQSQEVAVKGHLRTLRATCNKLAELGVECGGIAYKADSLPVVFGSQKGHNFFATHRERFVSSIQGIENSSKHRATKPDPQEEKAGLKTEVRKLFNACWARAGGKGKSVPYKDVLKYDLLVVTGLPEGCVFNDPSNMGINTLRDILKRKDIILFELNRSAPETTACGELTPPTSENSQCVYWDEEQEDVKPLDIVVSSENSQCVHEDEEQGDVKPVDIVVSSEFTTGSYDQSEYFTEPCSEYKFKPLVKTEEEDIGG